MNTATTLQINSRSSEETEAVAAALAKNLRGGEVIELKSDLGGGKTTFVKGLVAALGSTDHVASPTFTIEKQYMTPQYKILHFDFYRMQDAGLVAHALEEALLDNSTICCIEWGGLVESILPENRIIVSIEKDALDEQKRMLTFVVEPNMRYVLRGIEK